MTGINATPLVSGVSRRTFLQQSTLFAAGMAFPVIRNLRAQRKLGVALVGLGYYSTDLLAPALQQTKHCELRGIVTGTPAKIPLWQSKYGVPDRNVYNYGNMGELADNDEIDVVYIVLPTGLHAKYAIIAAEAGKHVWCEKPMARTTEECQAVIEACRRNRVKLSIGYRMQHEPNTRRIMELADEQPFGEITGVHAEAGYYDSRTNHWKQDKELGGGALYDMGVYPINAIRYSTGREPIAVVSASHSTSRPEVYHEVDETTEFTLEFENGLRATGRTSLGLHMNRLQIDCADGWYRLEPFQSYTGVRGMTSSGEIFEPFQGNQQALQMDNDAKAIMDDTPVLVPGKEGYRDIAIVEAIYQSAREGQRSPIRY